MKISPFLAVFLVVLPFESGLCQRPDKAEANKVLAEDKLPAPTAPFVRNAPDPCSWVISVTNKAADGAHGAKSNAGQIKTIETAKQGKSKSVVTTFTNGSQRWQWFIEGVCYTKNEADQSVAIFDPQLEGEPGAKAAAKTNSEAGDFADLDWVNAENYQSVTKLDKKACYLFVHSASKDGNDERSAWIDTGSKLPLQSEDRLSIRRYRYNDPTTDPLEVPPAIAEAAAKHHGDVQAREEYNRTH